MACFMTGVDKKLLWKRRVLCVRCSAVMSVMLWSISHPPFWTKRGPPRLDLEKLQCGESASDGGLRGSEREVEWNGKCLPRCGAYALPSWQGTNVDCASDIRGIHGSGRRLKTLACRVLDRRGERGGP